MGTANFARPENADHYYVILDNQYDEETGETYFLDSSDIQEFDNIIESELAELVKDNDWNFYPGDHYIKDYSRNYEKTGFGKLQISKQFGDIEIGVDILPLRQNGYYEGATLDYDIRYWTGVDDGFEILEDFIDQAFDPYYSETMNAGLCKIQAKNGKRWVEEQVEFMHEKLEAFFAFHSSFKLKCTARLSNGEAIYEKA